MYSYAACNIPTVLRYIYRNASLIQKELGGQHNSHKVSYIHMVVIVGQVLMKSL